MAKRTYPLELVLRAHGPAELVNADEETLWASDADEDFRDEFPEEFLAEEDIEDILNFLCDAEIISEKEFKLFASEEWSVEVEILENTVKGPGDDDDDEDDDD
jgi:hypothetical protein